MNNIVTRFFGPKPKYHIPQHNVIMVRKTMCEGGHACAISPGFVLTRLPCSATTYCTDEPALLFYAEGSSYEEIVTSLGNKICHWWQIYSDLDEDFLNEYSDINESIENFRKRITFINDVRDLEGGGTG